MIFFLLTHLFFCEFHCLQVIAGCYCYCVCEREKDRDIPVDHEEQQNFPSSICFASSPMNHDPVLTSSWANVLRIDLQNIQWKPMNIYASVTVYEKKQVEKNYLLIEIN